MLLRQVIEGRLARLGEEAQRTLAIAAVLGQEVPLALWATVTGTGEEALAEVVERGVEARVLEEASDGGGVRFAHALLREALYEGTALPRRRAWHRRAGEALAALPSPDPDAVAHHFRQAGDPRAAAWLTRAGERAARVYAWLSAADRLEAALALLPADEAHAAERARHLFALAALQRHYDTSASLAAVAEAIRLAADAGDRPLALQARFLRAHLRCLGGDLRAGLAELPGVVAELEGLPPPELAAVGAPQPFMDMLCLDDRWVPGQLAEWLAHAGRYAEARALAAELAARPGAVPGAPLNLARGLAQMHALLGQPDEAERAFATLADAYHTRGNLHMATEIKADALRLVLLPYRADRVGDRRRATAEVAEGFARAGAVTLSPRLAQLLVLQLEGRWAELRRDLATLGYSLAYAEVARHQGAPEEAWTVIRTWLPEGPDSVPGDWFLEFVLGALPLAAALALDTGDLPTARAYLTAHDRHLAWSGAVRGRAEGAFGWAAYHRAAGDLDQAGEHAAQALAHASEPRQPLALLAAHRTLGELATAAGRHAEAQAYLDQALALAESCEAPYERALTLLALAELRAAAGAVADARALLDDVRAICTPLEARPALARADALDAQFAAPAAPHPPRYPAGLTAREVEVLGLVAQGLTDAQVAERLYLSPRTIGRHLASIYNKLGVATRLAAARFALDHHLA